MKGLGPVIRMADVFFAKLGLKSVDSAACSGILRLLL